MREIGHLPNSRSASIFSDFLLTKGMKSEPRQNSDQTISIWLIDETRLNEARQWLTEYQQNPDLPSFSSAISQAKTLRDAESKLNREYAKRVVDAGSIYDSGRMMKRTPVVTILIAISIGVSLWTNFGKKTDLVINYINFTTPRYDDNNGWVVDSLDGALGYEPWRLVAPMFLHMNFMHLLFNMSWVANLGGMIEREKSSKLLLMVVLITHIASAFTEYFWDVYGLDKQVILFGGFSGAVYGLIGFVWMYSETFKGSYIRLSGQNLQLALIWMVLCFTGLLGPVANGAHAGGLVAGMLLGMLIGLRDERRC